jgi:hypothetical protein
MNTTIIIAIIAVLICICSSILVGFYFTEETPESSPSPSSSPSASVSTPSVSTPSVSTPSVSTPSTPTSVSTVNANPGEAISCTGYNPKGEGAIYRYDGDKKMRHYPNPEIAGSWDPNWGSGGGRKIDCTGFTLGADIALNPASTYKNLCNKHNKCLASPANNSGNGVKLIQYDKTGEDGQLWRLNAEGNLCNKHNKCLASPENNSGNGVGLIQWDKSSEQGQLWTLNAEGNLCNKHNKCLASPANNSGNVELIQWDKTGEQGQLWSFV